MRGRRKSNSLERVRKLINKNADVNKARGMYGETTLLYSASDKGHTAVVKLLIENGADVNLATTDGLTPLI